MLAGASAFSVGLWFSGVTASSCARAPAPESAVSIAAAVTRAVFSPRRSTRCFARSLIRVSSGPPQRTTCRSRRASAAPVFWRRHKRKAPRPSRCIRIHARRRGVNTNSGRARGKKIPLFVAGQGEVYVEKIPLTKHSPCNWRIPVASQQPEWRTGRISGEYATGIRPENRDVNVYGAYPKQKRSQISARRAVGSAFGPSWRAISAYSIFIKPNRTFAKMQI